MSHSFLSSPFRKCINSKEAPVLASITGLALCDFIVEYFLIRYWMTGYLKLRFLWRREMRSGDYLTCLRIIDFSILVGGMMCFVGDIIVGRMEGVVICVGDIIFGRMKGVVNFVGDIIFGRMEGVVTGKEDLEVVRGVVSLTYWKYSFVNWRWNICNSIHPRLFGSGYTRTCNIVIKNFSQFF